MRVGTAYFVSRETANRYYAQYGESPERVAAKLAAGEIHIGRPPLKDGEVLSVIPDEGRYQIEERDAPNPYEQKLAARKERLEDRADRKASEGDALYNRAHKMAEAIPFGQPILVGHHSEKRDRNYRGKIHNTFGKAFETMKEGKELAGRAASVGTGGISSDDPEAVRKLRLELAELEAEQVRMVAANKLVRKADVPGLMALGYAESTARKLLEPDFCGRKGFPDYMTSNNGANIRRIKARIEQLEKASERETKEVLHNSGVTMVENAEANRVQLIFPGKPGEAIRAELKSRGFRWSPMEGAWQRHLNNAGIWAAKCILETVQKAQP